MEYLKKASSTLCVLVALAVNAPAAQQVVESDSPLVSECGVGFFKMFIKYGRVGMGSGDYIVTTSGTNSSFEYTIPAGSRSVSGLFLFHNQGQMGDVYIDGRKRISVDTFARSSVAQRQGGVVGEIREVPFASDLDPSTSHSLRIVNTAASTSDSAYRPRELNQGPQLALDALRVGDFPFGTVSGTVKDDAGRVLSDLRMTINSPIGPITNDAGHTVFYTDGAGRYSLSGLIRGAAYTLSVDEPLTDFSTSLHVPVEHGTLIKDILAPCARICRPRMAVPIFVKRGEGFDLEVDAPHGSTQWRVNLKNAYKSIPLSVISAVYGPGHILESSQPGWRISVTIPKGTPLELWDLEVVSAHGSRREPKCVKVMETFDASFYVAQITDVHCYGDPEAKNDKRMAQYLKALDTIGARFIAITGDLCHFKGVRQAWGGFSSILRTSCSDTPTCVLPGNHDTLVEDGSRGVSRADMEYNHQLYERLIGPARYDFRMGSVYVLAEDIFSGDPAWAGRRLAATTAQDQIRLVLSHYHSLDCEPTTSPTILLYGHNHINEHRTNGVAPHSYPALSILTTKDENKKKQLNEFRLVRFSRDPTGHWNLGPYTYNGSEKSGVPIAEPMGQITSLNIQRTYRDPNDGTRSSNRVAIFNQTAERFETAIARFVLTNGCYAVTGGSVVDKYLSDDQTKSIVLVKINAAPFSTTSATIDRVPCP